MRSRLVERLSPLTGEAHRQISGTGETLSVGFVPGNGEDFASDLASSQAKELRLRQTIVGPHRDDIELIVEGKNAQQFASEGQQRTVAIALKIAQARSFQLEEGAPPLLLLDDVFGELDPVRRNALLSHLPADAQKLVTATSMQWRQGKGEGSVFELREAKLFAGS
jgi:DNA replication and repair protein RecF